MKYIGYEREEEAERWARNELGIQKTPDFYRAVSAVDNNGDFVCVVVMTNFTARNVDLNIVMKCKKVFPKGVVTMFNEVFTLVFGHCRMARATGLISSKNARSRTIAEKFGFKLEGIMRSALPDDDVCIYGMLAEDYKTHAWCRG